MQLRMETMRTNLKFRKSGKMATIAGFYEDECETIHIKTVLIHNKTNLLIYYAPEAANGVDHYGVMFYPNLERAGYEFTEWMLKERRLSRSLMDEECQRRRKAL